MGRVWLIARLVGRDLRYRPGPAALLVLAITAATATLTLGLVLRGVTSQPYLQTRAATKGPDVVAQMGGLAGGPHVVAAQARTLIEEPGVTGYSGPYPVASAVVRSRGLTADVEAEGRAQAPASLDQPKVTAGTWVRGGGVVLERTFAEALGVSVGDRVTLNSRPFRVVGIAVTAASLPYPNLCHSPGDCLFDRPGPFMATDIGSAWVTEPDARALASAQAPLSYVLNLKLASPAAATAFASEYGDKPSPGSPGLIPWQAIQNGDGLLKAAGGTPGTAAVVLLAENLTPALIAAAAGLAIGWGSARLAASPGAGLVGTPGAPAFTLSVVGAVVAVALAVALAATLVPAIRGARASTVSALADTARQPRLRDALTELSAGRPLLLGLRLVARRPRRALLSAASVAVTATWIVAVLAFHAMVRVKTAGPSHGLSNPVVDRDEQMLMVLTVVVGMLTVLNALCTAWVTVRDTRLVPTLARGLGASPDQVTAGIAAAQVLPAVPGALLGIPLGIGLFATAAHGAGVVIPPVSWLAAAVSTTLAVLAVLAAIPASVGAARTVSPVRPADTS